MTGVSGLSLRGKHPVHWVNAQCNKNLDDIVEHPRALTRDTCNCNVEDLLLGKMLILLSFLCCLVLENYEIVDAFDFVFMSLGSTWSWTPHYRKRQ